MYISANCVLENKDPSLCWGRPTVPHIRKSASDFGSRKASNFPEWMQFHTRYGDAAISNARMNTRIWYGNSAHVGDGCRQQHCIENLWLNRCRFTWLLLTTYRKLPSSYPTVPLPTLYDLPFSHSRPTCVTNRQTSDRRHILAYQRFDLTVGQSKSNKIM